MDKLLTGIRLCRPMEWCKNIILFAPLFFSPDQFSWHSLMLVGAGFVLFSIVASSIYIINDIRDAQADQFHPIKKNRPIASKKISKKIAWTMSGLLLLIGLLGSYYLSPVFLMIVSFYFMINIAYSFGLKKIAVVDVFCIAIGMVLRVIAGAELIRVSCSVWILLCVGLLALFLAFAKRRDDIVHHINEKHRGSMAGYSLHFIDMSIAIILSMLLVDYTIYAITLTPHFYWTIPIVLLGLLRYLQIIFIEKKSGSPTHTLITDPVVVAIILLWIIVSATLIY